MALNTDQDFKGLGFKPFTSENILGMRDSFDSDVSFFNSILKGLLKVGLLNDGLLKERVLKGYCKIFKIEAKIFKENSWNGTLKNEKTHKTCKNLFETVKKRSKKKFY